MHRQRYLILLVLMILGAAATTGAATGHALHLALCPAAPACHTHLLDALPVVSGAAAAIGVPLP